MLWTDDEEITVGDVLAIILGGMGLLCFFFALVWGYCALGRQYDVWAARKAGEAKYAHAESTRQIKTLEAKATMESSRYLADAEILRAEGVAEANRIIGDSLKGNESYIRYLWIHNLADSKGNIVYVPTECGLPILEANRLK